MTRQSHRPPSMHAVGRRGRLPLLAAAGLIAVLALAGCSDDGESTEGKPVPTAETSQTSQASDTAEDLDTQVPDLCTLFTAEDFQNVTGETAGTPESDPGTGAIRGTCSISAEAGFPLVMLGAYNESDRKATMSMAGAEPVDDLGTEAYWDKSLGLIVPLEGKDWYLQVFATDGGADLERSVKAAEIALDRLGE